MALLFGHFGIAGQRRFHSGHIFGVLLGAECAGFGLGGRNGFLFLLFTFGQSRHKIIAHARIAIHRNIISLFRHGRL